MKTSFDASKIANFTQKVARTVAEYTAYDVRSRASRSMKSGGKNRRSKTYKSSAPGSPPLYHTGGIKNAIAVEETEGAYLIGPQAKGGSKALKTLERGGNGEIVKTVVSDSYASKLRRRPKQPAKGRTRPTTKRPYFVDMPDGKYKRITQYRYFYTTDAWNKARNSAPFQSWASGQIRREKREVPVKARPYMKPALDFETSEARTAPRVKRVVNKVKAGFRGKKK